ncbi:hypothetical protein AAG570_009008 [Ranatra chinensis]|uniref:Cyclin N-terminal domain-containing protein n=1 Tax=Ranatra chinensis TaxID=642074 RepID=A0ABD0YSL6_9HEMI
MEQLPDALQPLLRQLDEALSLETKFQPNIQLPHNALDGSEVTIGIRDGSAHVLRCLKMWYDLPSDVLFIAANLMDRFLTKMKVRPKHMACISVACFQLGCRVVVQAEPTDVLAISQCKCTTGDLMRMQEVISSKLATPALTSIVTPGVFLRLFHALLSAVDVDQVYSRCVGEAELCQKLEVITCDGSCSNFRACEVALVLVCSQLDTGVAALPETPPVASVIAVVSFAQQLQQLCQISDSNFYACHAAVLHILARYNAEVQTPHRQRLVWKVSQRTLRRLRPTDRLVTTLPTIDEHGQLHLPPKNSQE